MYEQGENVYYYITTLNENYPHPAMPEGAEEGIVKGLYLFQRGETGGKARVQLLGCGSILREVIAGAALLKEDFDIDADVWSAPSFNELARDGQSCDRWNRMHPDQSPRKSWVEQCLDDSEGPVIAASDYIKTYAEQIRPFVRARYEVLGTDGYGRSDSREALRRHFEVDRHYVVLTALKALADDGKVKRAKVREAMDRYQIDADKPEPLHS
jgi:pyruvate dehydrogenase E1 component